MYSVLEDEDLDFQDDYTSDTDDNPERHEEEISAQVTVEIQPPLVSCSISRPLKIFRS